MVWAICLPKNEVGEVSEIKKMHDYLRDERNFEFPEVIMLDLVIDEFAGHLRRREAENEEMLRILDEEEHLLSVTLSKEISLTLSREISAVHAFKQKGTHLRETPLEIIPLISVVSGQPSRKGGESSCRRRE